MKLLTLVSLLLPALFVVSLVAFWVYLRVSDWRWESHIKQRSKRLEHRKSASERFRRAWRITRKR